MRFDAKKPYDRAVTRFALESTISKEKRKGEEHIDLRMEFLEHVRDVIKEQEKMIEELEERVAIMEEGENKDKDPDDSDADHSAVGRRRSKGKGKRTDAGAAGDRNGGNP